MNHISFDELFSLPDLWHVLQAETRDIWLYGMGNGADKILAVLAEKGITATGVFASDGFVRGQVFHGMPVRSFSDVCAAYGENECVVLLSFGSSRPEVLALIDKVAERYPLFVPDVPVCGTTLFDADFLAAHQEEFKAAREALFDEESRTLFDNILAYKLTGDYALLRSSVTEKSRERALIPPETVRGMADFGAYNGDTAREMLTLAPLSLVVAVEPDKRNFKKLSLWASEVTECRILCHHAAVYSQTGTAAFDASGNRNAGLCTGREESAHAVPTVTADEVLKDEAIDYVKYDVEGAEYEALLGSASTLKRCRPRLKIACYHRSEDLFSLPLLLADLAPRYRLYLVREDGVPAWDLDLLAVPK